MSACAVAPLPKKIPFCAVGLSYFDNLLSLATPAVKRVFGLIIVKTLGVENRPEWVEIYDDELGEAANVSREVWLDALSTLIKFGYIKEPRHNKTTGRREYAVSDTFRQQSSGKLSHGKCLVCSEVVPIDHRFIPVPHIVLRKMGACLDPAAYDCLLVILRYTLRYSADRGVYAVPEQLDLNDFERFTGYTPRSITNALATLCDPDGYALVERKLRPGKPSIYCPVIENFFKLERREARVIHQPKNRDRAQKAKTEPTPIAKLTEFVEETPELESAIRPYGFCIKCDRFVSVNPISEAEIKMERSESPPIRPPGRENRRSSSKLDDVFAKMKALL